MQDPTNTLYKLKAKLKRQLFIVQQTLDDIVVYEAWLRDRGYDVVSQEVPELVIRPFDDVNQFRLPGA